MDITHLLQKGENQHVEFKTSFNDEVIISLVAFSNAKGGAVYIGVTDDGTAKGVLLGKETVAQWINDVKNKTAPVLIPDVETVVVETKTIAVLQTGRKCQSVAHYNRSSKFAFANTQYKLGCLLRCSTYIGRYFVGKSTVSH